MVRRRREAGEIIVDILEAALNGAKKTHIMGRANLNRNSLHRYLEAVLGEGLLVKVEDSFGDEVYRTSGKGREFLRMARKFYSRVPKRRGI